MTIAEKIKDLRIKRLLTQEQMAKILDITTAQICKIEKGKCEPSFKTLKKIKAEFKEFKVYD